MLISCKDMKFLGENEECGIFALTKESLLIIEEKQQNWKNIFIMMNINDFLNKTPIAKDWQDRYVYFVPKFIESAQKYQNWKDWDKDIFKEFFETGKDQCVSSLAQKYFDKEEQTRLKENWNMLSPMLQKLAESQSTPDFELYESIKSFIRKFTKDSKKAATNRLIASLQPENLCTIINEAMLYELIALMKKNEIPNHPQKGKNWFETSNNVINYFKTITGKSYGNICTLPWQLYQQLKYGNNNISNIDMDDTIKDDCIDILTNNHNLILTGAPGTGKTYLAKQIAKEMGCSDDEIGFVQFHPSFDYTDFVEGLRPKKGEDPNSIGFERKDGVFKEFCKNALSTIVVTKSNFDEVYSKFIEDITENGLTLKTPIYKKDFEVIINSNNNLFAVPKTKTATHMSITKEMIKDYMEKGKIYDWKSYVTAIAEYIKNNYDIQIEEQQNINKKYVFIIDEINRGEISKIFGELFFSIDPGYRGVDENGKPKGLVKTQYQNLIGEDDEFYGGFYIPENVYIIGTMNDIDRSVESMDFAFRRRFAFKEIKADENVGMLENLDASVKDKAINRMKNLNNAISQIDGLSSAYHIGGSYFLKLKNYDNNFDNLWDYHIEGLLREYLRGNPEIEKQISDLKTAYDNEN